MFVNFNILNQLGSPAINSNTFANRPAAGQTGRLFVSTDTFEIYRDNGTTWDLIGGPGTSTITGTGTATQVAYFTSSQAIGSSANLYWDNTNTRLGIGTSTPGVRLDIHGTGNMLHINSTSATANALMSFQRTGTNVWRLGDQYNGGSNFFELHNTALANNAIQIDAATNKSILTSIESYSTGLARGNYLDYTLSLPNATTFTSPNTVTALGATLNLNIAGSATIPAGARSGADFFNGINFTSAGTFTVNQSSTIRAFSNVTAGWAFNGSAVGTVTHLAGLRVLFPTNSGSAINVTDNYALLINNQNANTGTITYTNRWGIYQEGASDLNYMAANLLLGSTVNTGDKLQVTGTAIVSSTFTANGISSIGQEQAFTWQRTTGTASDVYSLNADSSSAYLYNNTTANALMTWLEGGNVGIGTTAPATLLNLSAATPVLSFTQSTDNSNQGIEFRNSVNALYGSIKNNAATGLLTFQNGNNTGDGYLMRFITDGTERMRITSGGLVGINTNAPSDLLTVFGTGGVNPNATIKIAGNTNYATFLANNSSGDIFFGIDNVTGTGFGNGGYSRVIYSSGSYPIDTYTNAAIRTRLTSGGNFLIGTTTDNGRKLQVNGDISANSIAQSQSSATTINTQSANTNSQGAAHNYRILRHYPVVSLGTKLIIPFVSQGNLNSTTVCKIIGHSARYNSRAALGFEISFSVGHLNVLSDLTSWNGGGNYSAISIAGMTIEIDFTTAYTSATADGIYVTIEYMTNVPSYSIDIPNIAMN